MTAAPEFNDRWNLRHLWAFCTVAECNSINKAAARLNFSQPAISQCIAHLENNFGETLFTRSSTGMHVTNMGDMLLQRLRRGFEPLTRVLESADVAEHQMISDPSLFFRMNQLAVLMCLTAKNSLEDCAEDLRISEKSVARNIRTLEQRIGRSVVLRDGESVRLNRLGERIARAAKLFLREIELAREEMSAERGSSRGRLVVGALPLVRTFIVPRAMLKIAEAYPEIRVQLVEAPYDALVAGIREGGVDILVGALREPLENTDIAQVSLFSEILYVVARRGHPALTEHPGSLTDLLAYPWIAPRQGSPARHQFDMLMASAPRKPRVLLEVASHIAVRSVLLESDCLALISRHQIRYEEARGQLTVIPVDLGQSPRDIGYTVRAGWRPTPVQRAFLAELKTAVPLSLESLKD